jgi:hypothetical protein
MADVVHSDVQSVGVDFIHDPKITDSKTVESFCALKFRRLGWERVSRQPVYAGKDTRDDRAGNRLEVFLDRWFEPEAIGGHVCGDVSSSRQHSRIVQISVQPQRRDREDLPSAVKSASEKEPQRFASLYGQSHTALRGASSWWIVWPACSSYSAPQGGLSRTGTDFPFGARASASVKTSAQHSPVGRASWGCIR